jgi:hypothetical protein
VRYLYAAWTDRLPGGSGASLRAIIEPTMDASHPGIQDAAEPRAAGIGFTAGQRLAIWLALSVLAALIVYAGFRGYLNPELLFHFAAGLHC